MPDAELRRLGAQAQEVRTMLHRAQKSQISLSYSERIWGSLPEVILEGEEILLACRAIPGNVPPADVEAE